MIQIRGGSLYYPVNLVDLADARHCVFDNGFGVRRVLPRDPTMKKHLALILASALATIAAQRCDAVYAEVTGLNFAVLAQGLNAFGGEFEALKDILNVAELPIVFRAGEALTYAVDFKSPPTNMGPGAIVAGSTWFFQAIFRDTANGGAGGFNYSDGMEILFAL